MWQHVKLSDVSLVTRLRYSLVIDEDVKKQNKETHDFLILIFLLSLGFFVFFCFGILLKHCNCLFFFFCMCFSVIFPTFDIHTDLIYLFARDSFKTVHICYLKIKLPRFATYTVGRGVLKDFFLQNLINLDTDAL